jgi:hypothetical protein
MPRWLLIAALAVLVSAELMFLPFAAMLVFAGGITSLIGAGGRPHDARVARCPTSRSRSAASARRPRRRR